MDETGRLAGRGAYLCRDAACWQTAVERGVLTRALGVPMPPELRAALRAGPAGGGAPTTTQTQTTMTMTMTTTGGDTRGEE